MSTNLILALLIAALWGCGVWAGIVLHKWHISRHRRRRGMAYYRRR